MAQQHVPLGMSPHDLSPVERRSRSRFRSFFSRKKQDKPGRDNNTPDIQTSTLILQTPSLQDTLPSPPPPPPPPKTPVVRRARSITWTHRSKSAQRAPKVPTPQPPQRFEHSPLIEAYSQAILHATIDIPSNSGRKDPLRRMSAVSDFVASTEYALSKTSGPRKPHLEDDTEGRIAAPLSTTGHFSLTPKIFMMVARGSILQYSIEGNNDRLPEKVLELGLDSIAVASDAIAGRHWVLRISADGTTSDDHLADQTPKSTWSRKTFRNDDSKREAREFLLIFETAKSFDTWLTTVRREIDTLGGFEHPPEQDGIIGELQHHQPLQKFQTSSDYKRSSQSYSHLPGHSYTISITPDRPESPQLPPPLQYSSGPARSIASSTGRTNSSMEKMRKSSISDATGTTPGTSIDGSAASNASESPANDTFPVEGIPQPLAVKFGGIGPPASKPKTPKEKKSNRSLTQKSTARKSSSVEPTMLWSYSKGQKNKPSNEIGEIPERASPSEGADQEANISRAPESTPKTIAARRAERRASEVDASPSRPTSTLAPLPTPGTIRNPPRFRRDTTGSNRSEIPSFSLPRPATSHDRTTTFSLFPKRNSSLEQVNRTQASPMFSPPLSFHTPRETPGVGETDFPFPLVSPPPSSKFDDASVQRPKSTHSNIMSINTTGHHTIRDDIEPPQRSPAVSEAHFVTNFGTRSVSSLHQGRGDATRWSKSTVELPLSTLSPPTDVPFLHRRLSPQKSLPNVVFNAGPSLGPPPSGPLPPVPLISSTPSPRIPNHGRVSGNVLSHNYGKSSISSHRSASGESSIRPSPRHVRGASSISSVASVSTIGTAPASPNKPPGKHTRKLSSVSSVGSLGSVSGWMAASGANGGAVDPLALPISSTYVPAMIGYASTSNIPPLPSPGISVYSQIQGSENKTPSRRPSQTQLQPEILPDIPYLPLQPDISISLYDQQQPQQQQQNRHQVDQPQHQRGHSRSRSGTSSKNHLDRRLGPDGEAGNSGIPF